MKPESSLDPKYVNQAADLPYGLEVGYVVRAMEETYRLYHGVNEYLRRGGFGNLEHLILGNSLSGILSEFLVKNLSRATSTLEANRQVGGYPDLLPTGRYEANKVLKGTEGIEVKASIQKGGWQGHNPEDGWVMVFRYVVGGPDDPEPRPLSFVEVLCARLSRADWSFSGRKGASRRTPTASIRRSGVEKLRSNFIYRWPGVGVGKHRDILAEEESQPDS